MNSFPKYPKIETLFERDNQTRKVTARIRCPEFSIPTDWLATEKIDGTNVRVGFDLETGSIQYGGRTDNAQLSSDLWTYLTRTFTVEALGRTFEPARASVVIYGEGYGPKIQSGGAYREDVAVRIFDVRYGDLWLEWKDVEKVAAKLEVSTVPCLAGRSTQVIVNDVRAGFPSHVPPEEGGKGRPVEGVVARTIPLLLNRRGQRVMWKLKTKDF
jgi:hypothetical protein